MSLLNHADDDGLPTRDAGSWVRNKLQILGCYLPAFGVACKRTRRWYYVDGFSGPGLNRLRETGELLWGSPIIALRAEPSFHRCLLLERNKTSADALGARVRPFGERAMVRNVDCNRAIVPLMRQLINDQQPCLCVFDPEGTELEWNTISGVADFKRGRKFKVEQLILFPTDTGFVRMLPTYAEPRPSDEAKITGMIGSEEWHAIYEQRRAQNLTSDEARTEYVRLFARRLREELGYRAALDRQILRHGRTGHPLYFLIFATDNEAGERIMDHCFETVWPAPLGPEQLHIPGIPPPTPRRRLRD